MFYVHVCLWLALDSDQIGCLPLVCGAGRQCSNVFQPLLKKPLQTPAPMTHAAAAQEGGEEADRKVAIKREAELKGREMCQT